jgi:hypothetical protein
VTYLPDLRNDIEEWAGKIGEKESGNKIKILKDNKAIKPRRYQQNGRRGLSVPPHYTMVA